MMDFIDFVIDDGIKTWNKGIDVFITSPYGIFILFCAMFWWLTTKKRRM